MKKRPLGVTIIAIVLMLGGVSQVLVGTESLGYTKLGLAAAAQAGSALGWTAIISGALSILVGFGLFTLSGWSWLLAIGVLAIRVVADVIAIATHGASSQLGIAAITNAVISGVALWYFLRPNVKAAFGR